MNLTEYCERLREGGFKVVLGSGKTVWVSHERFSMLRQPAFAVDTPSRDEIRNVFKQSHAAMLSFGIRPSDKCAANSSLYLCTDSEYCIEKLGQSARSHIRRGLDEFDIRFLEPSQILTLGMQSYCDTLARTGQSIEHRESFESFFRASRLEKKYLGALKGEYLAAFLMVTEVDDWISIGAYSANEFLSLRPNNALIYFVLQHYLVEKGIRVATYGLSSVQASSSAEGLNRFKLKMGFESIPVHRVFIINPLFRPLVNRFSWKLAKEMLRFSPKHPLLKKAEGALRTALQGYSG